MCLPGAWESRREMRVPGTVVAGGYEVPRECWELNPDFLARATLSHLYLQFCQLMPNKHNRTIKKRLCIPTRSTPYPTINAEQMAGLNTRAELCN